MQDLSNWPYVYTHVPYIYACVYICASYVYAVDGGQDLSNFKIGSLGSPFSRSARDKLVPSPVPIERLYPPAISESNKRLDKVL